jgi:hypothetical protein
MTMLEFLSKKKGPSGAFKRCNLLGVIFQQFLFASNPLELEAAFFVLLGLLGCTRLFQFFHNDSPWALNPSQFTMKMELRVFIMKNFRRKAINQTLVGVMLCASAWANTTTPSQYEDIAHEHKGCPENSMCDAPMGKLLSHWESKVLLWMKTSDKVTLSKNVTQSIAQSGYPAQFYTREAAQSGFKPASWASSCALHNPKAPGEKILRGQAFIRGFEKDQVLVSRGDTEFQVPHGDLLHLRPVVVFNPTPVTYWFPLDEKPIFLEAGRLHTLVESYDFYMMLAIPAEGRWTASLPPGDGLTAYFDDRKIVDCPKEALAPKPPFYATRCETLLNRDNGKTVTIQLMSACD